MRGQASRRHLCLCSLGVLSPWFSARLHQRTTIVSSEQTRAALMRVGAPPNCWPTAFGGTCDTLPANVCAPDAGLEHCRI